MEAPSDRLEAYVYLPPFIFSLNRHICMCTEVVSLENAILTKSRFFENLEQEKVFHQKQILGTKNIPI